MHFFFVEILSLNAKVSNHQSNEERISRGGACKNYSGSNIVLTVTIFCNWSYNIICSCSNNSTIKAGRRRRLSGSFGRQNPTLGAVFATVVHVA